MTDAELTQRLKAAFGSGPWETQHVNLQHEAADRIEALTAYREVTK